MTRAPRVLLLTTSFPPAPSAGAVRTWSMATYLHRLGWTVTVMTVDASQWVDASDAGGVAGALAEAGIERIEVANPWPILAGHWLKVSPSIPRAARRIVLKLSHMTRVDPHAGFARAAERKARGLTDADADVILVSVPSFSMVPVARRIARRLRRPLVIDYRDLWTFNPLRNRSVLRREIERERKILGDASAVITTSESSAEVLDRHFGIGAKLHVLTNGFDPALLGGVRPALFDHFAIVHAGGFYPPKSTAAPLLRALALLHRRDGIGDGWRFHNYGRHSDHVRETAREEGLPASRFECHGHVPRSEALAAVAGAGLAVAVGLAGDAPTVAERGVIASKVYEAIGLGRQMLVIAAPGSNIEDVVAVAGRGRAFASSRTEEIAAFIAAAIRGVTVPPRQPETYDWGHLAPRLSDILRQAAL